MTFSELKLWFTGAMLLLAVGGCAQPAASVSGQVTLDGQPLETGNVSFTPTGTGAVAIGAIRSGGRYEIHTGTDRGLTPGDYLVTVVATQELPPAKPTDPAPVPQLLTPAKYNDPATSGLKCTVHSGGNTFNIELSSK